MLLDANLPDDRRICFEYSFRVTDSQERNCISDTIAMVLELEDRYQLDTGKVKGVTDYIYEKQYGHKRYSREYLKKLKHLGNELKKNGLLEKAQQERWIENRIEAEIEKYDLLPGKKSRVLRVRVSKQVYDELKFHDSEYWESFGKVLREERIRFVKEHYYLRNIQSGE